MPAVVIIFALTFYFASLKPMLGNVYLIQAFQSAGRQEFDRAESFFKKAYGSSALGRSEVAEHLAINSIPILGSDWPVEEREEFYRFAKAVEIEDAGRHPEDGKKQLLAGSFLLNTGQTDEALPYLTRAQEIMPGKHQPYFDIGSAYFLKGDKSKGLLYFKQVYDLVPDYPEAQVVYLLGAIYAGERELEKELLSKIEEKTFVFNDRVLNAYYSQGRLAEVRMILDARKRIDPANAATYDQYLKQLK